jgi:hypothetical protein
MRVDDARRRSIGATLIIDFARAEESVREITDLIKSGLVHVPASMCFHWAAHAHQMIETGHVCWKTGSNNRRTFVLMHLHSAQQQLTVRASLSW